MTAPATKTMLLLDRALEAMRERAAANEASRIDRAERETKELARWAVEAWQKKLGITVAPSAVKAEGGTARTTSDGVNLAYRYADGDRFYAEVPCPRRDESGDGTPLEHGYVMVEFHDLADLGDVLTTEPQYACLQCQERSENERATEGPHTARVMSPLERLSDAIQDVVDDTIRRSIEPQ